MKRFYQLLERLAQNHGLQSLTELIASSTIPKQGVYFFFDTEELTEYSSTLPRVVRIGTHAVSTGSTATLRTRLRTHLGTKTGHGNHRGSVFRLHVGAALIMQKKWASRYPKWGIGQNADARTRDNERPLEVEVSRRIGAMKVLCLEVGGPAGTKNLRSYIEQNAIALFTETNIPIDYTTRQWLGQFSPKNEIRTTGLWNIQHVGSKCDFKFLKLMASIIERDGQLPL